MKTSTLIKAKRTIAGSLLLIAAFSQTDMALAAFGFGNADEAKVVTVYDEKGKQVITTNATSFKRVLSDLDVSLNSYDKYWTSTDEVSNGSMVVVERAVPVTIIEDGKSKVVYTTRIYFNPIMVETISETTPRHSFIIISRYSSRRCCVSGGKKKLERPSG